MSLGWDIFSFVFVSIIAMAFVTVAFILYFRRDEEMYNLPVVFNLQTFFTDGHAVCIEKKIEYNSKGLIRCTLVPRDMYVNPFKRFLKIPEYKLILKREYRKIIPKGVLSGEREVVIYEPLRVSEMPVEFRKSQIGQWTEKDVNYNEMTVLLNKWQDDISIALRTVMEKMPRMTTEELIGEFNNITREIRDKYRKEESSSSIQTKPQRPEMGYGGGFGGGGGFGF